jgi:hypothetical protein
MKKNKRIITEAEMKQQLEERQKKIIESFGKGMKMLGESDYLPAGTWDGDPMAPWNEPEPPEYVDFYLDPEFSNFAGVETLEDLDIINFIVKLKNGDIYGEVNISLNDLHTAYPNNEPLILAFLKEPEKYMENIGDLMEEYVYDYMDDFIDTVEWDEPDYGYSDYDREDDLDDRF